MQNPKEPPRSLIKIRRERIRLIRMLIALEEEEDRLRKSKKIRAKAKKTPVGRPAAAKKARRADGYFPIKGIPKPKPKTK